MLTHAEIVVGTPDSDFLGLAVRPVYGSREFTNDTFKIGKDAIASFGVKLVDSFFEKSLIVHHGFPDFGRIIVTARISVHSTNAVKMPRRLWSKHRLVWIHFIDPGQNSVMPG
jgi:hypothetical protein